MVSASPKHLGPLGFIEGWQFIDIGSNCGKPVIKHDMTLGCDGSCLQVKHQGRGAGVERRESHQLTEVGTSFPTWNLLAILELLL